jgi:hypothetical protein
MKLKSFLTNKPFSHIIISYPCMVRARGVGCQKVRLNYPARQFAPKLNSALTHMCARTNTTRLLLSYCVFTREAKLAPQPNLVDVSSWLFLYSKARNSLSDKRFTHLSINMRTWVAARCTSTFSVIGLWALGDKCNLIYVCLISLCVAGLKCLEIYNHAIWLVLWNIRFKPNWLELTKFITYLWLNLALNFKSNFACTEIY